MENEWAGALKEAPPLNVSVVIEPVYFGKAQRPDSFQIVYTIEGRDEAEKKIKNEGTQKPSVCYTKKLNPDLFLKVYSEDAQGYVSRTVDEEGYIQWQPMPQKEPVDFHTIENRIGFQLNTELKAYYSSYLFFSLLGSFDHNCLDF